LEAARLQAKPADGKLALFGFVLLADFRSVSGIIGLRMFRLPVWDRFFETFRLFQRKSSQFLFKQTITSLGSFGVLKIFVHTIRVFQELSI